MVTQQELISKLEEVKALLKQGWTQREYARTKEGEACGIHDVDAVSFCLAGAIERTSSTRRDLRFEVYDHIAGCVTRNNFSSLSAFNDNSTQEEVLAGIDYTIKEVKEGRDFLN